MHLIKIKGYTMKTKTTLLAGLATMVLAGCGSGVDNGSGGNFSGTQYLAFSKDVSPRADYLFRTDGTASGTTDVSDIMLPQSHVNLHYEALSIVKDFGNFVYSKGIIYRDSDGPLPLPEYLTTFYKTKKSTGDTQALEWASNSRFYEIGNALYRLSGEGHNCIEKILTDGTSTCIDYPNGVHLLDNFGSVQVNNTLIIGTKGATFKFDPSDDSFSELSGLSGLNITRMYAKDSRLSLFGREEGERDFKLLRFSLGSPSTRPEAIDNFDGRVVAPGPFFKFDDRLYFTAMKGGQYDIFSFDIYHPEVADAHGAQLSILSNEIRFREFDGALYYPYDSKLYKIDPSVHQVSVAINYVEHNSVYIIDEELYYAGKDTAHGIELWKYTGGQSTLVRDINPGVGDSHPLHVIKLNGKLVFQAAADGAHNNLYSFDGTTLTPLMEN
jgi:ELWxxDGT repeat protein